MARQEKIYQTMTDLVVAMLDQQIQRNEYESVLISALAAMGLREDGQWKAAENYTTIYLSRDQIGADVRDPPVHG